MTPRIFVLLFFLFEMNLPSKAQNEEFELLLTYFENPNSSIPQDLASKYFDIEFDKNLLIALSDRIIIQNERFVALSIKIPCAYGSLCYEIKLRIFNHLGELVETLDDFESAFKDDGIDDKKDCVLFTDHVFVFRH